MKDQALVWSAFFFTCAHSLLVASAQTPPVRILPLGDSITYGSNTPGGYRFPLYVALTNAGYAVDYVGTQTGNATNLLPDAHHQGMSGWVISRTNSGLEENLYQWLNVIDDPDVVLLHIGTNDFGTTNDINNAVNRLDSLVARIATNRPAAHIIVTTLLPRGEPYNTQIETLFNPFVEGKVAAQQALGRKVHYLDMHGALTLSDTYDNLHPNAGGYAKMAEAWFAAVTNIITPYGDTNSAPAVSRVLGGVSLNQATITFTKPVSAATATNLANYAIDGGLSVLGAALSADQRKVTLTTSPQALGTAYTVTLNHVSDITPSPGTLSIAAGTTASFKAVCRTYQANVPESSDYLLAYSLDLPGNAKYGRGAVPYAADNSLLLQGLPLDRVAYYVELQCPNTPFTYLWVSMDAFTNDVAKIGVPTLTTGVVLQKQLTGLNILCNDPGITTGSGLLGNIEFWPSNYSAPNSSGVPDASGTIFDWGDQPTAGTYGCMQLHNYAAQQTLFTFSNWGTESSGGATPDIGIGNCPSPKGGGLDWTFSNDANMYSIRTLQILVKRAASHDTTPPAVLSAQAGFAGNLVQVVFSEPLAPDSAGSASFSVDGGVDVLAATLLPDLRTVNLTTTPQPPGATLTLAVDGVRDGAGGIPVAAGTRIPIQPPDILPPEIVSNVGTNSGAPAEGYRLVYTLDIPVWSYLGTTNNPYRFNQGNATATFDRVAYYLELQKDPKAAPQYLWASMDAFTPYLSKIGVPTRASKAFFQQYVTNLFVQSNVGGVSNGAFAAGGNLEFWPYDYSNPNALGIPGADSGGTYYDFGDTCSFANNHGSMQLHNHLAKQTLFGMNNWGNNNAIIGLGIGNCPSSLIVNNGRDWTFAENAGSYSRRRLHVLARPGAAAPGAIPSQVAANVPSSAGYRHLYTIDIPVLADFNTNSAAYYSANNYAPDIGGFSRVAYYLELQAGAEPSQFVWTAMDAFTSDARKLGIPTNNCFFQQTVDNLEVLSNVGGVSNGTGFTTGNIEFWPSNYGTGNSFGIPGASPDTFDFGDGGGSGGGGGHGCMQVHHYGAQQTLFAINHFNSRNTVELGIGNRPTSHPDWTFANNGSTYNVRRLYVFILPGGDTTVGDLTKPALVRAVGSTTLRRVTVHFSEPVSELSASPANFTLSNGITVLGAELLPNLQSVLLTTSPQTPGQTYTVTVSGVRDRSPNANLIRPASAATFVAQQEARPAFLSGIPEAAGFTLVHHLAVSNSVSYAGGANYLVDESFPQTQSLERVAYCLELAGTNGITQWAYVSMDAFADDLYRIGVPTGDRGARYQQYVSNLAVYASESVAGTAVATGLVAAGNIEFWPNNYGGSNAKGIPGASSSAYDFGDSIDAGVPVGHGCMQVHNYLQAHTILSLTSFGSNGRTPGLGVGNRAGGGTDLDWTSAYNAGAFSNKNLFVLARWGATPPGERSGAAPIILTQPRDVVAQERERVALYVQAMGAARYQWRHNGVWIPGATRSFLEIASAQLEDEGLYDVLIFGSGTASTASASASLQVISLGTVLKVR